MSKVTLEMLQMRIKHSDFDLAPNEMYDLTKEENYKATLQTLIKHKRFDFIHKYMHRFTEGDKHKYTLQTLINNAQYSFIKNHISKFTQNIDQTIELISKNDITDDLYDAIKPLLEEAHYSTNRNTLQAINVIEKAHRHQNPQKIIDADIHQQLKNNIKWEEEDQVLQLKDAKTIKNIITSYLESSMNQIPKVKQFFQNIPGYVAKLHSTYNEAKSPDARREHQEQSSALMGLINSYQSVEYDISNINDLNDTLNSMINPQEEVNDQNQQMQPQPDKDGEYYDMLCFIGNNIKLDEDTIKKIEEYKKQGKKIKIVDLEEGNGQLTPGDIVAQYSKKINSNTLVYVHWHGDVEKNEDDKTHHIATFNSKHVINTAEFINNLFKDAIERNSIPTLAYSSCYGGAILKHLHKSIKALILSRNQPSLRSSAKYYIPSLLKMHFEGNYQKLSRKDKEDPEQERQRTIAFMGDVIKNLSGLAVNSFVGQVGGKKFRCNHVKHLDKNPNLQMEQLSGLLAQDIIEGITGKSKVEWLKFSPQEQEKLRKMTDSQQSSPTLLEEYMITYDFYLFTKDPQKNLLSIINGELPLNNSKLLYIRLGIEHDFYNMNKLLLQEGYLATLYKTALKNGKQEFVQDIIKQLVNQPNNLGQLVSIALTNKDMCNEIIKAAQSLKKEDCIETFTQVQTLHADKVENIEFFMEVVENIFNTPEEKSEMWNQAIPPLFQNDERVSAEIRKKIIDSAIKEEQFDLLIAQCKNESTKNKTLQILVNNDDGFVKLCKTALKSDQQEFMQDIIKHLINQPNALIADQLVSLALTDKDVCNEMLKASEYLNNEDYIEIFTKVQMLHADKVENVEFVIEVVENIFNNTNNKALMWNNIITPLFQNDERVSAEIRNKIIDSTIKEGQFDLLIAQCKNENSKEQTINILTNISNENKNKILEYSVHKDPTLHSIVQATMVEKSIVKPSSQNLQLNTSRLTTRSSQFTTDQNIKITHSKLIQDICNKNLTSFHNK